MSMSQTYIQKRTNMEQPTQQKNNLKNYDLPSYDEGHFLLNYLLIDSFNSCIPLFMHTIVHAPQPSRIIIVTY